MLLILKSSTMVMHYNWSGFLCYLHASRLQSLPAVPKRTEIKMQSIFYNQEYSHVVFPTKRIHQWILNLYVVHVPSWNGIFWFTDTVYGIAPMFTSSKHELFYEFFHSHLSFKFLRDTWYHIPSFTEINTLFFTSFWILWIIVFTAWLLFLYVCLFDFWVECLR